MSKKQLFILDGHALVYRAFYAVRELTNSKGQPTNAVFGFVNILNKLLKNFEPEYLTVCFDTKGPTHRKIKYNDYKIQRPSMPEDLRSQVPIIKDILKAYRIPTFELKGYEADDIIATLSSHLKSTDLEVIIVSEDKDLYQLLNGSVKMFSVRQDALLNHDQINQKCGYESQKIADFIGLAGDKSDNIPGVDGVGEVTARHLINEFGSLENIIKNIDQIKKIKVRERIQAQTEQALLSKELAVLDRDVPITYDLKKLIFKAPDRKQLFEIFKDLEFKRLADQWADEQKPLVKIKLHDKGVTRAISSSKQKPWVVLIDEECLYLSCDKKDVYLIKLAELKHIESFLEDKTIVKIVVDIKNTRKFLHASKVKLDNVFDCMLAAYLVNPSIDSGNVVEMAWQFLKESIDQDNKEHQTIVLLDLYDYLERELKKRSLQELYDDLEFPLADIIYKMEQEGVCLDVAFLKKMSKECTKKISLVTKKLYEHAGEKFNINSPKQLSKILFEKLKLPVIKKTKTGFSTDEGVLTTLALSHEFPAQVLTYRQLSKLQSTYIDALPKLVNQKTNRIHADFLQTGTETGRLSARNPNLQNIPIKTDLGRQVRKAIIPSTDKNILLAADYSQIELRVLAHLSNDHNLIKAFNDNQDIHAFTASLMHDVAIDDVTQEMRYSAKRINFGIVYGMSAFGLSKDLAISPYEAQEFIDTYFQRYPDVKTFMDAQIAVCEKQGYVTTLLKRRRYIPEINSKNKNMRQFAQRQAINTPVQGSAADIIKLAMIKVQKKMESEKLKSRMIMTVHDELVFDVLENEQEKMCDIVRASMEHAFPLKVPTNVSIKIGKNWLEMTNV